MQDRPSSTVSALKLISLDGHSAWITANRFGDYGLHPVFLRFVLIVILAHIVIEGGSLGIPAANWQLALVWTAVALTVFAWLFLMTALMRGLMRRGLAQSLYMPLALAPLAVLVEAVSCAMAQLVLRQPLPEWRTLAPGIMQNFAVLVLFDMLHGRYVAPAHPFGAATGAAPSVPATPSPPAAAEPPAPEAELATGAEGTDRTDMIRIGTRRFPLGDIIVIRTEEHYLSIVTTSGKWLERAKLSGLPALHASQAGMQINRSVWVARNAIVSVENGANGTLLVRLVTGDEERVARMRVFAFRNFHATARRKEQQAKSAAE